MFRSFVIAAVVVCAAVFVADETAAPAAVSAIAGAVRQFAPQLAEMITGVAAEGSGRTSPAGRAIRRVTSEDVEFKEPTDSTEYPRMAADDRNAPTYLWSKEELAKRDGTNANRELMLSICGEVYDVGTGKDHYGPNKGYSGMAGRDASRGFSTGEYTNTSVPGMHDLTPAQIRGVMDWRKFYREHETYRFVGLLEGDYYTEDMKPTQHLLDCEEKYEEALRKDALRVKVNKEFLTCNSKFEQANPNIKLWCDNSYHAKGSRPVQMRTQFRNAGENEHDAKRCVCATSKMIQKRLEENKSPTQEIIAEFRAFPECRDRKTQSCVRPKGSEDPPESLIVVG